MSREVVVGWTVIPERIGEAECAEHYASAAERCSPCLCSTFGELMLVLRFLNGSIRGNIVDGTLGLDFWLVRHVSLVHGGKNWYASGVKSRDSRLGSGN